MLVGGGTVTDDIVIANDTGAKVTVVLVKACIGDRDRLT